MHTPASVLLNRLLARARLRHMQVLVQLAELGSVRRTAEAIGMTQPGVTQLLADLESMVGTPLFHRHARGVRPTAACADVLPMARQVLQGLAAGAEAVAARQGMGEGVVRLFGSAAAINGLLVRALFEFNDLHPSVQVQLKEAELDDLLLGIARGEVDCACCREPAVLPEGWTFRALLEDDMVVACAASHPLARKRRVTYKDLERETWLPAPVESVARRQFEALCEGFSQPPRICQVITRVPAATWWLLRQRSLLTVVPGSVVRPLVDIGELAVLKLGHRMPMRPLGMLTPSQDAGSATERLADFLQGFVAKDETHGAGR